MKKIFAFAIALVAMATSMVSCNNDNADFIEQKAPVAQQIPTNPTSDREQAVEATIDFMLPVTDVQLEMMSIELHYTIGGKTYTVTTDEMEKGRITDPKGDIQGVGTGMLLTYRVPGNFTVDQLKDATVEFCYQRKEEGFAKYQNQLFNIYVGFMGSVKTVYGEQIVGTTDFWGDVNISDPQNAAYLFENIQHLGSKTNIIRH